jgi:integrase
MGPAPLSTGAASAGHGPSRRSPDSLARTRATSDDAKLPRIRFHDLRHTAATLLLSSGVHPKVVQERLGHSQISVTLDTYSHVLASMQEEAAGKLDLLLDPAAADTAG